MEGRLFGGQPLFVRKTACIEGYTPAQMVLFRDRELPPPSRRIRRKACLDVLEHLGIESKFELRIAGGAGPLGFDRFQDTPKPLVDHR